MREPLRDALGAFTFLSVLVVGAVFVVVLGSAGVTHGWGWWLLVPPTLFCMLFGMFWAMDRDWGE